MNSTYCGLDCETCDYKAKHSCGGCRATLGKPFHGTCRLAQCCIGRGHNHCGECPQFPCDLLKEFSYHPTHGDAGRRIEALRRLM